ncbi:MAG: DUF1295 domain-containing protein [Sphaerochaetaceae bacterium]|jgi:steroid 5-alpha reductase family enzyme|nr:DUF1295 domain-containing protein [Sphaerochaetaceae bacterium]
MKITVKTIMLFFVIIIGCFASVLFAMEAPLANPLVTVGMITALTAAVSFLFGLFTNDYSWTDRLWSTSPVAYAWIYAAAGGFSTVVTLAAILVTLWGVRLTYNFARRDGYTGGEDYRWPILRTRIGNPVIWQLFNLLFIAVYQQFLFICFTLPLYVIARETDPGLSVGVIGAAVLLLTFLVLETIADQQQFVFQQSKHGHLPRLEDFEDDYLRGFRTSGLFAISRHPNYLGELGVWWSAYIMGSASTGSAIHWSIAGPILLTLLFIGSTIFTEGITREKYVEYETYRKTVWPIFPKLW